MAYPVDAVVFPTDISFGSSGGPEFRTEIAEYGDGSEQRNQCWEFPREKWDVSYGVRTEAKLDTLRAFFHARDGRARGFLFKNHRDYTAEDSVIGVGDNAQTVFQLCKSYPDISGSVVYRRKVTRPKFGTVVVKYDGTPISESLWTLGDTEGLIMLVYAPATDVVVSASFEFYLPMRFDSDSLASTLEDYLAESISVPLVEVRP